MSECVRHAPLIGSRQGELTEEEALSLALHLESCPRCQAYVREAEATEGLVREALLARAAERDFAPFVDQVMERIGGAEPHRGGVFGWFNHHWKAATAALVPALVAAGVFLYVRSDDDFRDQLAQVELSSEGDVTTVLQTKDGPVVLLAPEES
jgi:anti-sigma factor RsiW